jgi:hypothetical protein
MLRCIRFYEPRSRQLMARRIQSICNASSKNVTPFPRSNRPRWRLQPHADRLLAYSCSGAALSAGLIVAATSISKPFRFLPTSRTTPTAVSCYKPARAWAAAGISVGPHSAVPSVEAVFLKGAPKPLNLSSRRGGARWAISHPRAWLVRTRGHIRCSACNYVADYFTAISFDRFKRRHRVTSPAVALH